MTKQSLSPSAALLEMERTILLHVMAGRRGKEIAPLVGTSYDMVEKHIKTAREKLGGVSRMDAARLVAAEQEAGWVQNLDLQKSDLFEPAVPAAQDLSHLGEAEQAGGKHAFRWPFPTAGRADNDLTFVQRWGWILVLAIAFALMVLGLVATTGSLLAYLAGLL